MSFMKVRVAKGSRKSISCRGCPWWRRRPPVVVARGRCAVGVPDKCHLPRPAPAGAVPVEPSVSGQRHHRSFRTAATAAPASDALAQHDSFVAGGTGMLNGSPTVTM